MNLSIIALATRSDRGSQYISEAYVGLLNEAEISISMCNEVYENARGRLVTWKE